MGEGQAVLTPLLNLRHIYTFLNLSMNIHYNELIGIAFEYKFKSQVITANTMARICFCVKAAIDQNKVSPGMEGPRIASLDRAPANPELLG